MKQYTLTLDRNSINQLIKDLTAYKNSLSAKCDLFVQKLAEIGVNEAKAQIVDFNAIDSGRLYESIETRKLGRQTKVHHEMLVVADTEYAVYVEMGTGIVGADAPYPGAIPVIYAQGSTIHFVDEMEVADDPSKAPYLGQFGWFYYKNGKRHFTQGQWSKPFMWNASLEMHRRIYKIAKQVFG